MDSGDTITDSSANLAILVGPLGAFEDAAGNRDAGFRTHSVTNKVPPRISSVALTSDPDISGPDDDTYAFGQGIDATVTFNEAMTVTGTPQLELNVGGSPKLADFAAGNGTAALVFNYRVGAGDVDTNGVAIDANKLTLNGGTMAATADSIAAALDHEAVAANSGHKVDAVLPTFTSAKTSHDGTNIIMTFSKDIGSAELTKITPKVGGSVVSTSGQPTVENNQVTIAMAEAITDGNATVTVSFDEGAALDTVGNDIAETLNRPVKNNVPVWDLTLLSDTVMEGGASVTATLSITNTNTIDDFDSAQTVELLWGGTPVGGTRLSRASTCRGREASSSAPMSVRAAFS